MTAEAAPGLLRRIGWVSIAFGSFSCTEPSVTRVERLSALGAAADGATSGRAASLARRTPALELLDRHETGEFNRGAAEIVHYHAGTRRAFVVNALAGRVTVLELGPRGFRPGERALEPRRDVGHFGAGQVTSLAIAGDRVAVAVCAAKTDQRGRVAFYSALDLRYLGAVSVGFGPDMLTFTPDGQTLLVANEGEQVRSPEQRIVADPAGSVSIVDVSRGVERATVAHAGFEAFDGRIEAYRNAGVRIPRLGDRFFEAGEGQVRLSTDVEPEYIAVAPDGKTAWVSLQENDAVAVLDIGARVFTEILPLGVKDFSHGEASVASLPLLPARASGAERASSGELPMSEVTGLWFDPEASSDGKRVFYVLRGGHIERRALEAEPTRLAAIASTTSIGQERSWRGLVRDPRDGVYWVGDAERAVVYGLTASGRPSRELRLAPGQHPIEPPWSSERRASRGLARPATHASDPLQLGVAALAFDPARRQLYVVLQDPASVGSAPAPLARIQIVDVDPASPRFGEPLTEYLYEATDPGAGRAARRITGAVYVEAARLLVLDQGVRDSAPELRYVDLTGASDVLGVGGLDTAAFDTAAFDVRPADELASAYGVRLAHRWRVLSLPEAAGGPSAAGVALLDRQRVALVVNGRAAPAVSATVTRAPAGSGAALELVSFDEQNRFDASDRDGQATLRRWPVFGGYMPDGIEALRIDGADYFITANEGDTRNYDAKRLAEVELDPERFPEASALQSSHALGRLKISSVDGDLDLDGDLDEIHAFGARSLSIWDASGHRVFDTGSLLEEVTAQALGTGFNSNNDTNGSFDTRSDDKGPEPEGLDVAQIDGHSYVFLGLERVGGIVVLDVTDPRRTVFVEYVNPRNFAGNAERGGARDLGPEGLEFVPAAESPTGRGLLLVANEVSGTTTAYDVNL